MFVWVACYHGRKIAAEAFLQHSYRLQCAVRVGLLQYCNTGARDRPGPGNVDDNRRDGGGGDGRAPLEAARRVTVEVMEMKTTMVVTSTTTVETQWRRWRRRARWR